eukprot:COSAG04_NODE_10392_length_780_cov_1.922173_1_plen_48_part_01
MTSQAWQNEKAQRREKAVVVRTKQARRHRARMKSGFRSHSPSSPQSAQ